MNETRAKPRRRWFRFGLGTMFVVMTLISVWLGWQAKVVGDRRLMLDNLRENGAEIQMREAVVAANPPGMQSTLRNVPTWRRWMGDEAVSLIELPVGSSDQQVKDALRAFPEAYNVIRRDPIVNKPDPRNTSPVTPHWTIVPERAD